MTPIFSIAGCVLLFVGLCAAVVNLRQRRHFCSEVGDGTFFHRFQQLGDRGRGCMRFLTSVPFLLKPVEKSPVPLLLDSPSRSPQSLSRTARRDIVAADGAKRTYRV